MTHLNKATHLQKFLAGFKASLLICKLVLLIFYVLTYSCCIAQNLVYNGNFEDYTICPSSSGGVQNCVGWFSAASSPDYFNVCASSMAFLVPNNSWGYQQPYDGNAYMGGATYFQNYAYREPVRGTLIESLVAGTTYYVSFKVSLAEMQSNCGSNKIGALFTTLQYTNLSNPAPIVNYAQVYTNDIITDTANWTTVSGTFVADSAYNYVMIGNFFDNSQTDIHILGSQLNSLYSYYYIDDVCVSTDASLCDVQPVANCSFVLPTAFTPNGDNLNDKYLWVQNCSDVEEFVMRIYNRWGEIVFRTDDYKIGWDGRYKGKEQPADVYAVYVSVISRGKQVNKSATITLIR